jgi:hypothetical protein
MIMKNYRHTLTQTATDGTVTISEFDPDCTFPVKITVRHPYPVNGKMEEIIHDDPCYRTPATLPYDHPGF